HARKRATLRECHCLCSWPNDSIAWFISPVFQPEKQLIQLIPCSKHSKKRLAKPYRLSYVKFRTSSAITGKIWKCGNKWLYCDVVLYTADVMPMLCRRFLQAFARTWYTMGKSTLSSRTLPGKQKSCYNTSRDLSGAFYYRNHFSASLMMSPQPIGEKCMQSIQDLASAVQRVINNVEKVIVGKAEPVAFSLIAVICRGHVLIEDVPGVGKTVLTKAIARS